MKRVLFEVRDKFGSVLLDSTRCSEEIDSMRDVATKQHARYVLATGKPRSLQLENSAALRLSLIGG